MSEPIVVPGRRGVRGALDAPVSDAAAAVVACPPHPEVGGSRSDARLKAVADALTARGVACLRFDYGPWDEGRGERRDARAAIDWASERYDRVGVFGYSFGAAVALVAAAEFAGGSALESDGVAAVSALAPAPRVGGDSGDESDGGTSGRRRIDVAAALGDLTCPVRIVYGERDDTVDWAPIVDRARDLGFVVESVPADHHFVGQRERVAEAVSSVLVDGLG